MKKPEKKLITHFLFVTFCWVLMLGCKNDSALTEVPKKLKDIDGNAYKIVKIGNQVWMAENLKTTRLNDGTPIPLVPQKTDWSTRSTAGYCWYNNDQPTADTYGALYNWYTVQTNKLCPTGWHTPSAIEWSELISYSGGASTAGGKLKETGIAHWLSTDSTTTDEFNFTALPGGIRDTSGDFFGTGYLGGWWTATEDDFDLAKYQLMRNVFSNVFNYSNLKQSGVSVRCLKD